MSFSSATADSFRALQATARAMKGPVRHREAVAGLTELAFAADQFSRALQRFGGKLDRNLSNPDLSAAARERIVSTCSAARKATAAQEQTVRQLEELVNTYRDAAYSPYFDVTWLIDGHGV